MFILRFGNRFLRLFVEVKAYLVFFLIFFISLKPNAYAFDWDVGLRCDETVKISNPCYPSDAVMNDEGICECPTSGCRDGCAIDSDGNKDYYCYYPINVMDRITDPLNPVDLNLRLNIYYEEFTYTDSCGVKDWANLSEDTAYAWMGVVVGAGYIETADETHNGMTLSYDLGEMQFLYNTDRNIDMVNRTGYTVLREVQATGKETGPGDYYAVQPVIEIIEENGYEVPILRFYFSQRDKVDEEQIIINVDSSSSSDLNTDPDPNDDLGMGVYRYPNYGWYFDRLVGEYETIKEFSQTLSEATTEGFHAWRAIQHCENYDDSEGGDLILTDGPVGYESRGIRCYNTPYMAGLLMDRNDPSAGIRIPPPPAEPFFPDRMSFFQGGAFIPMFKPYISWETIVEDSFFEQDIRVLMKDSVDADDSTGESHDISLASLVKNVVYTIEVNGNEQDWSYQFFSRIENNDNFQKVPELCLYACLAKENNSNKCEDVDDFQTKNKNLKEYLTNEDEDLAKSFFMVPYNETRDCKQLPAVSGAGAITVNGRGIGSTYDEPKIEVTVNHEGVSKSKTFGISTYNDLMDIFYQDDTDLVYLKHGNKKIIAPNIIGLHQGKDIEFCADTRLNESCETQISMCQVYSREINGAEVAYGDCGDIENLSNNNKNFICLHNLYPAPDRSNLSELPQITHPFTAFGSEVVNDSYNALDDSGSRFNPNNNLCIPTPQKINDFSFVMTNFDKNDPQAKVKISYNKPRPYVEWGEGGSLDNLSSTDQGNQKNNQRLKTINGPDNGAREQFYEVNFDYFNRFRVGAVLNGGFYEVQIQKYDFSNERYAAIDMDDVEGLTNIGSAYRIGDVVNLNVCAAGDAGINDASFPETMAGVTGVSGSCTVGTGSPVADCNANGDWVNQSGSCSQNCPALADINAFNNYVNDNFTYTVQAGGSLIDSDYPYSYRGSYGPHDAAPLKQWLIYSSHGTTARSMVIDALGDIEGITYYSDLTDSFEDKLLTKSISSTAPGETFNFATSCAIADYTLNSSSYSTNSSNDFTFSMECADDGIWKIGTALLDYSECFDEGGGSSGGGSGEDDDDCGVAGCGGGYTGPR